MATLATVDMKLIDSLFGMYGGYVLPEWSHPVNAQGDPKIHDWRPQPAPTVIVRLDPMIQYSRSS